MQRNNRSLTWTHWKIVFGQSCLFDENFWLIGCKCKRTIDNENLLSETKDDLQCWPWLVLVGWQAQGLALNGPVLDLLWAVSGSWFESRWCSLHQVAWWSQRNLSPFSLLHDETREEVHRRWTTEIKTNLWANTQLILNRALTKLHKVVQGIEF